MKTRTLSLALALILHAALLQRARSEDQLAYRYGYYQENDDRIRIETHSVLFDVGLKEGLISAKGEYVHDAVSGATPSGAAPATKYNYNSFPLLGFQIPILGNTNNSKVPLQHMEDERNAGSLELPVTLGIHTITPQFSYSEESDYRSVGAALNYIIALNEKNTLISAGWAHSWDRVNDDLGKPQNKRSDDFLIGVSQLLGPKTVLGFNFTYGTAHGYLNDPYRFIVAANDLQIDADNPSGYIEQRPDNRDKYIGRLSVTQFITPANASVEAAYRYYHDTFGIDAHLLELTWYQKLGKRVIVAPGFRYYYQSAANFYYDILPDSANKPQYYSSDYRLSNLQSFTVGVNVTVKATKWLMFDAGYRYYVMDGLDKVTSSSAYPSANVFSIGARLLF
ncbi:MAG: DUF3570 domain-containing protein [Verrucomicrobiota bacterium]